VSDEDGPRPGRDEREPVTRVGGRSPKFWLVSGLSLLGFVLLVQNSTNTDVHVLWFTIRMPLVFLLVAMVLLGVGLDRAWLWRQRRR
jgi:uncharacterized integral membrane protein